MVCIFLGWVEDEAFLHSFLTNLKLEPHRPLCGVFCYCRMTELGPTWEEVIYFSSAHFGAP